MKLAKERRTPRRRSVSYLDRSIRRILVVDDEGLIRRLLVTVLSREGFEAVPVADAQEAIEAMQEQPVDLILLDLCMPGFIDGEDLLFALRDQGEEVPIIVISGWVDDEVTRHPPACVQAVMKKPIQSDALIAKVRQILRPN